MTEAEIKRLLAENAAYTEEKLTAYLSPEKIGDNQLGDAMRYAALGGGKRIRAFLARYFCRAFGGSDDESAPLSCAIEMVHAYSLIHDDMPCMDNDDMRRGKPSCHKAFGEAEALLAGDALLTYAFEVCASNHAVSGETAARTAVCLAAGAGANGMCGGQHYDLYETFGSEAELAAMQDLKTGALIKTACLLGYYAAVGKPDDAVCEKITEYALKIGLAFQIEDDILDATADEAALGKPVGSDAKNGKTTWLSFFTIDEARKKAAELTEKACEAIKPYDRDGVLTALAYMLLTRDK